MPQEEASEHQKTAESPTKERKERGDQEKPPEFPPQSPSENLRETVIRGWCRDTAPDMFTEEGVQYVDNLSLFSQLSDFIQDQIVI